MVFLHFLFKLLIVALCWACAWFAGKLFGWAARVEKDERAAEKSEPKE